MTPLDAATLHYHAGQFRRALRELEAVGHGPAEGALRLKCLIELDQLSPADELSRDLVRSHPDNGALHYYRGLVLFLQSQLTVNATAARGHYEEACRLGFTHAYAGLGLLAHVATDFAEALALYGSAISDDPEMENVRYLKIFQTHMAMKNFAAAEEAIVASRRVLAPAPSFARGLWSELYWLRMLFVRGHWQALRSHLLMIVPMIDPAGMPRVYRCACEARRWLELGGELDGRANKEGAAAAVAPSSEGSVLRDEAACMITSKPVLFELYEYLRQNGTGGADKEAIVHRLWQESYNPMIHDGRLYKAVARLRKILGDDARQPRMLVQKGRTYYLAQAQSQPPAWRG